VKAKSLVLVMVLLAVATIGLTACVDQSSDSTVPIGSPSTVLTTASWVHESPESHGFDSAGLKKAAIWAQEHRSDSLLVIHDGAIILEQYWNGLESDIPIPVYSITKSVVSTLIGIAQYQGLLNINDRVSDYIEEWVGTDSETVTIRDILSNDSGRSWSLLGDFLIAANPPDNLTQYAIDRGQQYAPGEHWQYNQMAIQCLERVLSVATGQSTVSYAQENLFDPLGMKDTTVETDAFGQMVMSWGMRSTVRDLACLGQLYLNGGIWAGKRILSLDYIRAATSSSNQINTAYGFLWWVNTEGEWYEPVTLVYHKNDWAYPDAPLDVYVASGLMGQMIMVSPSDDVVIVRRGHDPPLSRLPTFSDLYREIMGHQRSN